MTTDPKFLLSLDGGGLRGIIPAMVLAKLEAQTGRPAGETFAFIAGTSTGAIIAAGLAAGVPASEIVRLYAEGSARVIDENWWSWPVRQVRFYLHRGWQQHSARLYDLIRDTLGEQRDMRLNDASMDVMITARHVDSGEHWHFTNDPPDPSPLYVPTGSLSLAHCAVASSAEPMFFSPWAVNDDPAQHDTGISVGPFVDGGVGFDVNPVYHACLEAFENRGGAYAAAETIVVSLGSGSGREREAPRGLGRWIRWTFREMVDSSVEQQIRLVRRYCQPRAFYRINIDLGRAVRRDRLASLKGLRRCGETLANAVDWEAILAGETTPFTVPAWPTPMPPLAVHCGGPSRLPLRTRG